ncbi:sugar O-acetyltransferase [Ligilactobacillus pobuzihii]|uniref:sugar O-acetyltransferase n=1 Tax=Ligilactobacillus pobuzihii TaxID=449659 RepID=UPI0019D2C486|nr:sugar O-acetyltransferase [Ligilactobacillus pobuzihii]MBN7274796.1 sugar O-acetyltransferase [Ligilactobacillus pobuzihii]
MTLDEKFDYMLTGKPYNDLDPLLVTEREVSTKRTNKLNSVSTDEERIRLFRNLVGSAGDSALVKPNFRCEFGRNIHVGKSFYANYDCVMLDGAPIIIGDHVLFGPKVGLYTSNHLFDSKERVAGGCCAKPIYIGNNCWLGANVIVLPGISIKNNTIIGAGSVVTHDIPENVIAAGNPCKVIREITQYDKKGFTFLNK